MSAFNSGRSVFRAGAPSPTPAPAPAPAVSGTASGTASARLSSTAGATNEPVTFGMALREGAYPDTSGIAVSGMSAAQVEIRNTWPDGSAKYVVVSGRCTIPSGGSIFVALARGTAATGTALTEAAITAAGVDATLQFGGGPVMTLSALLGVAAVSDATGLTTNGRVRQLASGPVMSSWLYAARLSTGNAHVIGWMEVRVFAGGRVHILPWVENGFTRISGCAGQAGTLTFTMGGATRYTQADVHLAAHCAVVAQDVQGVGHWSGTAPDVYAAPDPVYLQQTGMVPPYDGRDTTGAAARLNSLSQTYSPALYGQLVSSPRDGDGNGTNNGDFDPVMNSGGYHSGIGPLPEWDAFYLTSGDVRAWRSVVANAMGYGRYGVRMRDELTLAPVNPADVPNKTLGNGQNISDKGANQNGAIDILPDSTNYDPGGANLQPERWAQTHHPSAGFTAYLLTGHEFFLELSQFVAGICFLRQNNLARNYGQGIQYTHVETTRGAAWGLRSIFQAAAISRDGSALKTGLSALAGNNVTNYHTAYVVGNSGSFGVPRPYSNFSPGSGNYRVNPWEIDFSACVWGYGVDLAPVSGATRDNMRAFFEWHARWPVVRLGPLGDATTYGFNAAGRGNSVAIAPGETGSQWTTNTGWFANPGELFQATFGSSNAANTDPTLGAVDSNNGFFPDASSYWGNLQMALAYAVKHYVPGAAAGYMRMIGAPNWSQFDDSALTLPVGSLRANNSPATFAAGSAVGSVVSNVWTPGRNAMGHITRASFAALPANTWVRVSGTSLQTLETAIEATGFTFASDDWSGGKDIRLTFAAWVGFADDARRAVNPRGGGHADSSLNGVWGVDLARMAWEVLRAPSQPDAPGFEWSPNYDVPPSLTFTNYTTTGSAAFEGDGVYADKLPDGTPTSAHTYNGVWYDSKRGQIGTGRVSKWSFDLRSRGWDRQRWTNNGGGPVEFTVRQELHYHEATDSLYGYFSLSDLDTGSWGRVQFPGANRVQAGTNPPNFALGNGGVGCSVRLDANRVLVLWCLFGVERWGIFNMLTSTWEAGSGNAITDGKNIGNGNEMQIALLIPTWGAQGQVIRRGTSGAGMNGVWWLFDIATKANLSYTPTGVDQFTVWPGNKWRSIPSLGVAIGLDDNSAISTNALLVMRYA